MPRDSWTLVQAPRPCWGSAAASRSSASGQTCSSGGSSLCLGGLGCSFSSGAAAPCWREKARSWWRSWPSPCCPGGPPTWPGYSHPAAGGSRGREEPRRSGTRARHTPAGSRCSGCSCDKPRNRWAVADRYREDIREQRTRAGSPCS